MGQRIETFNRNLLIKGIVPVLKNYALYATDDNWLVFNMCHNHPTHDECYWIIASNQELSGEIHGEAFSPVDKLAYESATLHMMQSQSDSNWGHKTVDVKAEYRKLFSLQKRMLNKREEYAKEIPVTFENASLTLQWCRDFGLPLYQPIHDRYTNDYYCALYVPDLLEAMTDLYIAKTEYRSKPITVNLSSDRDNDLKTVCIQCDSLIHAMKAAVFFEGLNYAGEPILFCEDCGKPFVKEKPRQIYCENCGSNAARQRRFNRNISGGDSNGGKAR